MVRLIAVGLCVVCCVVLSLLFVALGTVLVVDLVRHPPQLVQREVVYVLVPVPSGPTTTIDRTGGIQLPHLVAPAPAYQQPIILTPVVQLPAEQLLPATPTPLPPPDRSMCDPSYPTLCISFGVGNIYNCKDIDANNFPVYPPDEQGFDHDRDGIGCEKN